MTISSTTLRNSYSGNGSTTAFAYTFPINSTSEISVIERSATGTETVKSEGSGSTNYSIVDNGASGGTVTMVTAPASGTTLVLLRNTTLTQETDYVANDPFPAETHEDALDKLQMQTQELQEELDRSFKVSKTNTITSAEFTTSATDRASKTLGFDSDGNLTTVNDFLPAGGDSAQFTYSTTTTDSDPGSGIIRFNNTTLSSATIAYVDDLEENGTDVSAWVQSFDDVTGNATNRGRIRVTKANTLDVWHVWKISGAVTDDSGYTKLALTYIDGAGALADEDKVFLSFSASGEDGAIPGYYYKFDTGTSDADPGAGEISFNNGTYASVTAIYIDDADANGVTTQTDTITWDDSTSTIKGYLHIVDINDSTTYARFSITGSSTDASGYNKLAVTHLASNNTFSAADELSVHFTRQGDKGDTGSTGSTGATGATGAAGPIPGKVEGTNFTDSLLVGHSTTGTLSSAERNTGVGIDALDALTTGDGNTALGYQAGSAITTETSNTLIGKGAGDSLASSNNTIIGHNALGAASSSSAGNTAIGRSAMKDSTSATYNTAVGLSALEDTTGTLNIGIGSNAGDNITSGSGNVIIGGVDADSATGSRQLKIAGYDGSTTTTWITGDSSGVLTLNAANVTQQAITSSSNAVAWDASAKPNAYHITTENTTLSAPSNAVEGAFICLEINYNGSHTFSWNAIYNFSADTAPTTTDTDGKTDIFVFRYNGAIWQEVGRTLNIPES